MPDDEQSEEQTTILRRAKGIATKKSVAVGTLSGGVCFATLAACYQIFVTAANHRVDISLHWQEIKQREVEVKSANEAITKLRETVSEALTLHKSLQKSFDDFRVDQTRRDKAQWELISKKQDKP